MGRYSSLLGAEPASWSTLRVTGPGGEVWRFAVELALPTGDTWGRGTWKSARWAGSSGLAWVPVTGRVRGWSLDRGSDTPGDRPRVATASITLDNVDGRLCPWAASPATGHVSHRSYYAAGTLVRFGFKYGSRWLPQFTGEVETWDPQMMERHADGSITITAVDLLARLGQIDEQPVAAQGAGEGVAARLARLLAACSYPGDLSTIVTRGATLRPTTLAGNRLNELYLTADSDACHLYCDRYGKITTRLAYAGGVATMWPRPDGRDVALGTFAPVFVAGGSSHPTPTSEMTAAGYAVEVPYDPRTLSITGDRTTVVNDLSVGAVGGSTVTVSDGTSQSWYQGRFPARRGDLICEDPGSAVVASAMIAQLAWARPLVTCDIYAGAGDLSSGLLCIALHDLFDRLDVWLIDATGQRVRVPAYVAAMSQRMTVSSSGVLEVSSTYALASHVTTPGAQSGYIIGGL